MFHFSYIDTIMEDAYTKDSIMEVANFRICVVCICAYTEGAYTEEIYGNPNASFIYACFHICTFKEVVIRKCTFIRAFICVVRICAYTKARIYGRHHYGSGQLPYMRRPYMRIYGSRHPYMHRLYAHIRKVHIRTTHIRKVHIQKKFMVIQMHLPYMCASIYAHLRKLSSISAHLYVHLYASSVYVHIQKCNIQKMPLWKWPTSVYASSVYVHLRKPSYASSVYAHIQKRAYTKGAYTDDAYTEGAYTEKFTVIQMHLPYMCSSIYAHLRKLSSVNAHLYAFICVICICAYTDARIYGRCHYGSGQLPYMCRPYMHIYGSHRPYMRRLYMCIYGRCIYGAYTTHIQKVHIQKKFTVIQMHLPYMCASIYAHLRKLSSVNAHLYVHLYASSVYAHIRKRAYTEDTIMEVVSFHICVVRICAFTEAVVCICVYTEGAYTYTTMHIRKVHIWKKFTVIQMHLPYMRASIYVHLRKLSSVNAHLYAHLYVSSVYAHI
jgi:hypothetical protein